MIDVSNITHCKINLTNVGTAILMIIFIWRMECTAYDLIFLENLHVFFCKLPLWVYEIRSVYTANIYPIERHS